MVSFYYSSIVKYIDILYPNAKGGNCNPGINIAFDRQEEAIKEESWYKLDRIVTISVKSQFKMDQKRSNTTYRTFQIDVT